MFFIQVWALPRSDVKVTLRDTPLQPIRVTSTFANKDAAKVESEDEVSDSTPDVLDIKKEVVPREVENSEGLQYYDQYKIPAGWFKVGDHVYIKSEEDRPYIARIDKIWSDQR